MAKLYSNNVPNELGGESPMATNGKNDVVGGSMVDQRIWDALRAAHVTMPQLQELHRLARRRVGSAQSRLTNLVTRFPVLKVQLKSLDEEERLKSARTAHLTTGLRSRPELLARKLEIKSLMSDARKLESTVLVRRYERELLAIDNDLGRIRSYGGQASPAASWPSSSGRAAWQQAVSGGLPSLGNRR